MMQLPVVFAENMRHLLGEDEYKKLAAALQGESPVSVRVNPWKWRTDFLSAPLRPVPWAEGAGYLSDRPAFTFDPLFHAGCYYVQEASSMFVQRVLQHYVPSACRMLDLCAAPGGKSTLARSVLPEGSLLVSNEIVRSRAQVLAENMAKWGHPDVIVTQNAPADFIPFAHFFDVILADVPCSGEGMFRKDENAIGEWSMENVNTCWQRQRSIVSDVWGCLKPGGLFIYSTCTYNAWEDEENVRWMIRQLGAEPLEVPVDAEWKIKGDVTGTESPLPVYRFFPSHLQGEGFFLAVMRKPAEGAAAGESAFEREGLQEIVCGEKSRKRQKEARKTRNSQATAPSCEMCRTWLSSPEDYVWNVSADIVSAIPRQWNAVLNVLKQHLTVLHAGIPVALLKGKDWVPHHSLSMSICRHPSAFPYVEVDYETAIAYLRHEAIVLDGTVPRAYVLLAYRGIPLGFVKNIGNRANNLYPSEWRIRSGHLPEKIPVVL